MLISCWNAVPSRPNKRSMIRSRGYRIALNRCNRMSTDKMQEVEFVHSSDSDCNQVAKLATKSNSACPAGSDADWCDANWWELMVFVTSGWHSLAREANLGANRCGIS